MSVTLTWRLPRKFYSRGSLFPSLKSFACLVVVVSVHIPELAPTQTYYQSQTLKHNMSDPNCSALDSSWGPWAGRYCRGGLDFTLFFEEVVFIILPAAVLVLVAIFRTAWLMSTRTKMAQRGTLLLLKQV